MAFQRNPTTSLVMDLKSLELVILHNYASAVKMLVKI